MSLFPAVRIEGGLLGPDMLEQLLTGDLPGQKPKDFGLDGRRSLTDEMASVFADARAQWELFQRRLERLPEGDLATSVTRDAWVIPFLSLLGYELRYNPRAYEVDGLTFAISHRAGEHEDAPPVHIVGARQELGRLAPSGRPRLAPHSLVQEFLNRTERLWGIVTNGLTLRLLRESRLVRRQAYVEFDLRQIFEEQRFADFAVLYRLLHRSRLPPSAQGAPDCLLERYYEYAVEQGGRVRERLRDGVEECIKRLANGFLSHQKNQLLRAQVSPGYGEPDRLLPEELYRQLLRLVYRLLFLLVSEDRGLISNDPLYREHYGVARLRRLLDRRSSYTEHDDIWCSFQVLWKVLSDEKFASFLGAPPLNGDLFAPLDLDACTITNRDFLEAFWHLAYYRESPSAPPRRVNYAALDVEELGSVYESLLEYHPVVMASGEQRAASGMRFELVFGPERKSTGSYYTPPELVAELIRSALEPVIEQRLASSQQRAASSDASQLTIEEKRHVHQLLSRPSGLAERYGSRGAGIQTHQSAPEGRTLRTDVADSPSSDFGSSEHRRGLGQANDRGVSAVPPQCAGQPAGAGNPSPAGSSSESGQQRPGSASSGPMPDDWAPVDQPSAEPFNEKTFLKLWQSLPLATRRSLLAEHALLSIRVLDPACGSGHFLLAAARRLGKELAKVRTGEDEPAPERVREAIRDVVGHCIYGVDKNPLAVELCRVALWLEAHCEGKPLTFLDHRIRCGDSLVGVLDLGVLKAGIPDAAFEPVSDDDRQVARSLKRRNAEERGGQRTFFFDVHEEVDRAAAALRPLLETPDDTPEQIRQKAKAMQDWQRATERDRTACDLWTAAFFQRISGGPQPPPPITTDTVLRYLETGTIHGQALGIAGALAQHHRFFHWPLEFPEVFQRAASGEQRAVEDATNELLAARQSPLAHRGFDVVLSNPPWERIKLQEEEFFAARNAAIAGAPNAAARRRLIARLEETNPALWQEYQEALHDADATSKFLRTSGRYPLAGRGDINTYAVFAELARALLRPDGRAGIIVPTGIATDDTTKHFFRDLVERGELRALYDFENRKKIFPAIDSRLKFCLLTLQRASGPGRAALAEFAFFCHEVRDLEDPERRFTLSAEDFRLLNPNTGTAPIFRTRRDAELTRHIYRRVPVLINERMANSEQERIANSEQERIANSEQERIANSEWRIEDKSEPPFAIRHSPFAESNPWGVSFKQGLFNMSTDSHLFRTREELEREGWRLDGNVFVKERAASGEQRAAEETSRHSPFAIRYSPLYEAKMIHQYHHRFGDYRDQPAGSQSTQLPEVPSERLADPDYVVLPRYWVPAEEVEARLRGRWDRGWLLGWRDITNATNERTVIAAVIPRVGVGNKIPLIVARSPSKHHGLLGAVLCSLPLDYVARQKLGGTTLNFFIFQQLPILPPSVFERPCPWSLQERIANSEWRIEDKSEPPFAIRHSPFAESRHSPFAESRHSPFAQTIADWVRPRVLELTYTAWDLKPFADDLWESANEAGRQAMLEQWEANHGTIADHSPFAIRHSPFPLPPFRWDEERRFQLRCELDAAFFLLYLGTPEEWEREATPELKALFPTPREAVAYILDQFPIVKRKDEEHYGEYRTKQAILECYNNFGASISANRLGGSA